MNCFDFQFLRDIWCSSAHLFTQKQLQKCGGNRVFPFSPFSYRDIGILSASYTSVCIISFFLYSPCARVQERERKREKKKKKRERTERARSRIHPQVEHCRGLIGSYRAVMSHNGADNARDNTPPASRLSGPHPGHPPTYHTASTSLLSWNQHIPANLINIIADYAAPRSQWEFRAKRYRRYEILCALLSLSFSPDFLVKRIIRRQTLPLRIYHSRKTSLPGKEKRESFVIQRNLLLIVIRRNQSK